MNSSHEEYYLINLASKLKINEFTSRNQLERMVYSTFSDCNLAISGTSM